jgi:hypothetical protein
MLSEKVNRFNYVSVELREVFVDAMLLEAQFSIAISSAGSVERY